VHEVREVRDDLRFGHARGQIAQDVAHCDAGAADAGLAEANGGIEADPVEEAHTPTLRCQHRRVNFKRHRWLPDILRCSCSDARHWLEVMLNVRVLLQRLSIGCTRRPKESSVQSLKPLTIATQG